MINPLTQQEISDDELLSIAQLAEAQVTAEKQIEMLEKQLETAVNRHRDLTERLLPEAMSEIGLESFTLKDGTSIEVNRFYSAKIPDDKQKLAFAWLRDTGNESIIKREIKCLFGKGEDDKADLIRTLLISSGVTPNDKSSVHPQTLKAFVREKIESGEEFPADLFGVYVGNRTKVTPATK